VCNESLYIFKLYKKGKLNLAKVDEYFRKLCVNIVETTTDGFLLKDGTPIHNLIVLVDTLVGLLVNKLMLLKSLQCVIIEPLNDLEKVNSFVYKTSKIFKDVNNKSLGITAKSIFSLPLGKN
jgi:hypothetical protein